MQSPLVFLSARGNQTLSDLAGARCGVVGRSFAYEFQPLSISTRYAHLLMGLWSLVTELNECAAGFKFLYRHSIGYQRATQGRHTTVLGRSLPGRPTRVSPTPVRYLASAHRRCQLGKPSASARTRLRSFVSREGFAIAIFIADKSPLEVRQSDFNSPLHMV